MRVYDVIPRLIIKRSLNPDFSFSKIGCHAKVKESSLPYYLLIDGGRIIECLPFTSIYIYIYIYNLFLSNERKVKGFISYMKYEINI